MYIIPKIDEKIDNIYNPIKEISTNIVELENSLNEITKKLEDKRIKSNKSIDDKTENKKQLDNLNLKISWYEILDDYKSLEIQENLYKKLLLDIKTNKEELDKNYNEILKLQSDKQNVKIVNDKINLFLEYIFLTKDKLKIEYDNNQDTYIVKSHNKDIKPKDLSTGERNIIALCYFFTKILENTNGKDEFRAPCLIILDDPISSFDMENKVGLYTFFRMMFDKIMKNNSESKIINFTHSLETMLNFGKACSDIKSDYILFELQNNQLYDFKYKSRNDYQKMLNEIYNYAMIDNYNIENELDDTIGNNMRKLLESYSTFNYNKGIEELTRNDKILDKIENEENQCVLKDDMNKIYDAISKCDNIIIMSPIYMNQITGILKNVFDRFNPYCASENLKGKKIYLITVGQMSEEEQQEICNSIDNWFKSISEFLYFDFEYLYNFTSGDILEIDSIEKMYKKSKLDSIIKNIKIK